MQLSVIIVSYNVKYFLEQCLYAARRACANIQAEILVVDNASTDKSMEYLRPAFREVQFIQSEKNMGFGAACNLGLAHSKGSYFLFLNPDTIVPEDCFEKAIAFFQSQPDCGALGMRMIDGSGIFLKESKRMLPDLKASFFKMLGTAKLFPTSKIFARYYAGHLAEHENNEVDVLAGAFMMLNAKAAASTGGFDTDYFMYGEDVDLSYRIQKSGLKNYYFSQSTLIHFKGESTQRSSKNYLNHFYGAMHLFVNKHFTGFFSNVFIHFAIGATRTMAILKQNVRKLMPVTKLSNRPERLIVVAEKMDLERLAPFGLTNTISIEISLPIDEKKIIAGIHAAHDSSLQTTIVFVTGGLTNKSIITVMDSCKQKYRYLFHHAGSRSMVGSDHKDSKGRFMEVASAPIQIS